jgi:hypothetical protein
MGLRLLSKPSGSKQPTHRQHSGSQGEKAFHSPLLIIVVGLMSFLIFPIFLMLIESNAGSMKINAEEAGLAHFDDLFAIFFFIAAGLSFFYYAREQGAKK